MLTHLEDPKLPLFILLKCGLSPPERAIEHCSLLK